LRLLPLLLLLTSQAWAETFEFNAVLDAATDRIVRMHDAATGCRPCIHRQRAGQYAVQMFESAATWNVPVNTVLGFIAWESDDYQNTIDKTGTGRAILPIPMWCWGLAKLKVSTANDFTRNYLGWDGYISGHDLLYDFRLNIDVGTGYLRWCYDIKKDWRRALNAYKAGPTGETQGKYLMRVRMPDGTVSRREYAEWVGDEMWLWMKYWQRKGMDIR
jgi:soluble lytic murein transglycosylase-like protein